MFTHSSAWIACIAVCLALAGCHGGASAPLVTQPETASASTNADAVPVSSAWTTLGTRKLPSHPNRVVPASSGTWTDYNPPVTYTGSVTDENQLVTMDDGVQIALNVVRPTGGPQGQLPTIVTFTPYNKDVGNTVPLGGAINNYFVSHGYNDVLVDMRGTGRSGGAWDPFSAREQVDYQQVLKWIVQQPWSNGVIGLWGISASATPGLLAAASGFPAIKAVFATVAHGDIYRDVVFVGGQASAAFLPAWMAVVTGLAVLNPSFYVQPDQYLGAVVDHLLGLNNFVIPRTIGVLTERPDSYCDSDYWATKAPLEVEQGVQAPTFIVGGLHDIFQRSEPLNYEALKNHVNTKLLLGPWHHLDAAQGVGLPRDGVPKLDHIALMWFDHYLQNKPTGAADLPNVTQWVWGFDHYVTSSDWPHPQARAARYFLQPGGGLSTSEPPNSAAPATVLQEPVDGICSESAMQISLGILAYVPLPCWTQDNTTQALEVTFDTAPLEQDLYISGPIEADIWISTTADNAGVVVRVDDLAPDGAATALTSGLQTASLRTVDESRSRYLDGQMIQPWHPFTQASVEPVGSGHIVKVPVEIFPTSALIKKGHRLRISVGPSNFPFALMPLPTLLQSALGLMSIYNDAEHPSSIVLPAVPASVLPPTK